MEKEIHKNTLKDIESGKYRHTFLIYRRRSTDEPDNQKNSLSYQLAHCEKYRKAQRLDVAPITLLGFCRDGIISEKHSAFKDRGELNVKGNGKVEFGIERPKFHLLVKYLSKGYFKGVICLCADRISRNDSDDSILTKLERKGIKFRYVQATYEETSAGYLHRRIDGVFSAHSSLLTSERVKFGLDEVRAKAFCCYKVPVGYLNTGKADLQEFDPVRMPIIKGMFDLAEIGQSIRYIEKWAASQGFLMPPIRARRTDEQKLLDDELDEPNEGPKLCRPARASAIHRILRNRFYAGMALIGPNQWIVSKSHKAIVSLEQFEAVQRRLTAKNRSQRYVEPLDHPFRRTVRCEGCNRIFTPYMQKGRLYYSSRCKKDCSNTQRNINADFISAQLGSVFSSFHLNLKELEELEKETGGMIARMVREAEALITQRTKQKQKLIRDLSYLRDNKLALLQSNVYAPEQMADEEQRLMQVLSTLNEEIQSASIQSPEIKRQFVELSELIKTIADQWHSISLAKKDQISQVLFSELKVGREGLKYKAAPGFIAFESRFV